MTTKINDKIELINDQYFYGESVGVYLINLPDKILLFDLPAYSLELETYLLSKNKPLVALLSHGSCGIADGTKWQSKVNLKVYLHEADKNHEWVMMKPDVLFSVPPHFDATLEVIHTPGHSAGSVCLLDTETRTLFTGDTFGGTKEGEIRDFRGENNRYDDIPRRLTSCQELLAYTFKFVLPFHYEMILEEAKVSLKKYIITPKL